MSRKRFDSGTQVRFLRRAAVAVALTIGGVLALAASAAAYPVQGGVSGPTIASDKADYAPGETVVLSGYNWQAAEAVHIRVNDDLGETWRHDVDVTADEQGVIADTFELPTAFVAVYTVTATGPVSGTVTTSFTDGNLNMRSSPSTVDYTIDWAAYNGVTDCSGAPHSSATNVSVDGAGSPNTQFGVGATQSIQITAYGPSGQAFSNWSYQSGTLTANPVCIAGFSGNRSLTANWVASDSTGPVITEHIVGTTGNNDWYTSDVEVTFTVVDNESAITSKSAACDATTVIDTDTSSSGVSVTCQATSGGGTSTNTVTIKRDGTAPVISGSATAPPDGAAYTSGWTNKSVKVDFACTDALSGVGTDTVAGQTLTSDTPLAGTTVNSTGDCIDNAGNAADAGSFGPVKIDKTPPTLSGAPTTSPNGAGWYNSNVTIVWTASDALSGIDPATVPADSTISDEGTGLTASASVSDKAGNTTDATSSPAVSIDKTKPVVSVTGPANGATYTLGSVPAAGCSTADALSGVKTNATLSTIGGPVGSITATCSGAEDKAGNTNSVSVTYNVVYDWTGFFRPVDNKDAAGDYVFNVVKAGQAIPMKFNLGGNQGLDIFKPNHPDGSAPSSVDS